MRVNKKANLFHHDPAMYNIYGRIPKYQAFRMDVVWNPNGNLPGLNREQISGFKMQLISFIFTLTLFVCSIIAVYNFYY